MWRQRENFGLDASFSLLSFNFVFFSMKLFKKKNQIESYDTNIIKKVRNWQKYAIYLWPSKDSIVLIIKPIDDFRSAIVTCER